MSILIDETTTFIVQGITGREAVNLTRECLDYGKGAQVVGGVTPGRKGRDVHGVPVFDTVADAVNETGATASVIYVPAAFAADAILEAADAGIELVVSDADPAGWEPCEVVGLIDLEQAHLIEDLAQREGGQPQGATETQRP